MTISVITPTNTHAAVKTVNEAQVIIYDCSLDILHLHRQFEFLLRDKKQKLSRVRVKDIAEDSSEYQFFKDYHQYVVRGQEYRDFYEDTKVCLDNFRKLGRAVIHIDHSVRRTENMKKMTVNDYQRTEVIEQYLRVASSYLQFQYYPNCKNTVKPYCSSCYKPLGKMTDGEYHCPCGYITYKIRDASVVSKGESEYRPETTFLKELTNFQGKENIPLPTDLTLRLDRYFNEHGIYRDKILRAPLDKYGKRRGTSLRLLVEALGAIGYSSLYKRANSIGRDYWGWNLYNLDPYIDEILSVYRKIQEAYKNVPKTRKSNINSQGTLLRILEIVGIKIREEDFKLCITFKSSDECELLWKKTCVMAGIPYYRHF